MGALESSSSVLRCMAAEGLARLVQVVNDPGFTVSMTLSSFDKLVDTFSLHIQSNLLYHKIIEPDKLVTYRHTQELAWEQVRFFGEFVPLSNMGSLSVV